MSWTQKAEVAFSGPFVKFANGTEYVVEFTKDPTGRIVSFSGREKPSWEFPVKICEVGRTMSVTSKRLIDKLIAEDRKAPLTGRALRIKAIGDGTARDWIVESVNP